MADNSRKSLTKANIPAESLGGSSATAGTTLKDAGIYNAVITNFNSKDNTLSVIYDGVGLEEKGCVWGAGVFSGMLGFNARYIPPIGTQVVVAKGKPSVIIGARSSFSGYSHLNEISTATGESNLMGLGVSTETKQQGDRSFDQVGVPGDMLPGEFDLSNVYGVALTLLSNFSKLSAGDLAKVECHLLNDMVRILSTNFKQHTAWGDVEFYNDGRLNVVINGTSYPHESLGLETEDEKKYTANTEEAVDLKDIDAVNETGRWRLSQYVGFLGNFIHTIVSDPPSAMGSIAQGVLQAGKARVHINNDGTILCQSVAEIALERVTRIPVPRMKKRWEDGSGIKSDDFSKLEKKFLKVWNEPAENIHYTAYQLREYARYLSLFHSYSRFLQMSEGSKADYELVSEFESPDHTRDNAETDVKQANGDLELYDTYSTIRIMRDGSIVIWDGYGSSVVMSHGDIQHSAVNSFSIEAAGDIRITAGKNLYVKAHRNIEIAAIVGGLKLKSRAWFQALCEWGSVLLKSDAKDPNDTEETPDQPENPGDPEPLIGDAAIVLDATKGRTSVLSKNTIALEVTGTPKEDTEEDYSRSIVLNSKFQHIKMYAFKSLYAEAKTGIIGMMTSAAKGFVMRGGRIFADVQNFVIKEIINLGVGISTIPTLLTNRIFCHGSIFSKTYKSGFPQHDGHTFKFSASAASRLPVELRSQKSLQKIFEKIDEDKTGLDSVVAMEEKAFPSDNYLKFKFDAYSAYIPEPEKFFQSPGQQYISLDHPEKDDKYEEVSNETTRLKSAPRTESTTAPFPGVGAKFKTYTKGENLRTMSSSPPDSFQPSDTKLKMTDSNYVFMKLKQ